MNKQTGVLLSLMVSGVAHTASPDAWAAHYEEVTSSCVEQSGLRDAQPAGEPVDFDDRIGYTALVIQGFYPQPHMNARSGHVLCLFDKRSRTAHIEPADAMIEGH